MAPSSLPPFRSRRDRAGLPLAFFLIAAMIALALGAFLLIRDSWQSPDVGAPSSAFDFQSLPRSPAPARPQSQARPAPVPDSIALLASRKMEADGPRAASGPDANRSPYVSADERTREKLFLAQYDGAIKVYQDRLRDIGLRYHKKYPIVREVDGAFAGRGRYMAVKRRYEADRNLYQWARDTAALPEVRDTIKKYLARPEAWGVAVDMALDALKQPPPPPVYKEIARVMNGDPALRDFTDKVESDVQPNLGAAVTGLMGKDLAPLQGVMKDLALDKKYSP